MFRNSIIPAIKRTFNNNDLGQPKSDFLLQLFYLGISRGQKRNIFIFQSSQSSLTEGGAIGTDFREQECKQTMASEAVCITLG